MGQAAQHPNVRQHSKQLRLALKTFILYSSIDKYKQWGQPLTPPPKKNRLKPPLHYFFLLNTDVNILLNTTLQ